MGETRCRTEVQVLRAPHDEAQVSLRAPTVDPGDERSVDPGYTCSVCDASWSYPAVRNTGRCPACGSGLLRDGARTQ